MKKENILIIICLSVLVVCLITLTLDYQPPSNNAQIIQKTYTIQWYGNDTVLSIIYISGENTTVPVTHGEIFVVNGSSTIYDGNQFIVKLP